MFEIDVPQVTMWLLGVILFLFAMFTLTWWQERRAREQVVLNNEITVGVNTEKEGDLLDDVMDVTVIPMGNQSSLPTCPHCDHPVNSVLWYQNNSEHDEYGAGELQILACGSCNKIISCIF